ncbi:hypothetical protein AYI68_g1016 [Smittium mucronatum]|uniref:Uncharacterized protein n=1 Tax=Smittium mucronatum TaxID=133383 RepID=A0A1R0H6P2_9FUNG|nr:hypothetical protein AYI68_g1016 [Smittium mucronatum]
MSEDTKIKPNKLTTLLRQLMRKRGPQIDEEDPFTTPKISVIKLAVYKELSEALSLIKEDLFRTPLSLNCGEEVGYHATPDSDGACPSHMIDRLLSAIKLLPRTRQPAETFLWRNPPQQQPIQPQLAVPREASIIFGGDSAGEKPSSHEIDLHQQETSKLAIWPYVPKFLGRSSTEVTHAVEQDKAYNGGIGAAGKLRYIGSTATDPGFLHSTVQNSEEYWRPLPCPGS